MTRPTACQGNRLVSGPGVFVRVLLRSREELSTQFRAAEAEVLAPLTIELPKQRGRPSRFRPKKLVDDGGWLEIQSELMFVSECGQWIQALSDKARFAWRTLGREFREDAEDTVEQIAPEVSRLYKEQFAKDHAYNWTPEHRAQIQEFPIGPLKKLIRDGFKRGSPRDHIAFGLAGYPYGWSANDVRRVVEKAGGISAFIPKSQPLPVTATEITPTFLVRLRTRALPLRCYGEGSTDRFRPEEGA